MCNSLSSFVALVPVSVNGQLRKPPAASATPAPVANADVVEIKTAVGKIKTAVEALPHPVDPTPAITRLEGKVDQLLARPAVSSTPARPARVYGYDASVLSFWVLVVLVGLIILGRIGRAVRAKSLGALFGCLALVAVLAPSASAAVVMDKVDPSKFTAGTSTSISLCTKAATEDIRVAGSGVSIVSPTVSGECFNATLRVDASATVGKRQIEVQETPGATFVATGSEIEIVAAVPPPPPPPAGPAPAPPVAKPVVADRSGQLALARVRVLEAAFARLCSAGCAGYQVNDLIAMFDSPMAGTHNRAIDIIMAGQRGLAVAEATASFGTSVTEAKAALDKAVAAVPGETTVRGWARTEAEAVVKPVVESVAALRKDVDGHTTSLAEVRKDVGGKASQADLDAVRAEAARLRAVLAAKGSRGIKKELAKPAPPPTAKPAFKAADKK